MMATAVIASCPLCQWRIPLDKIKGGVKPHCEKTRQNVYSKQISISLSGTQSETQSMSFTDISDNIKNNYKDWKKLPIIVPNYNFAGISDRLNWTQDDMKRKLEDDYKQKMKEMQLLFLSLIDCHIKDSLPKMKTEIKKIFEDINDKDMNIFINTIQPIDIMKSNHKQQWEQSVKKLIQKYVEKSKEKIFDRFRRIKGKKAEYFVKEKNVNRLANGPGLLINDLSLNRDLKETLKKFDIEVAKTISARHDVETDSILIIPSGNKVLVQLEEIKSFDKTKWNGESSAPEENKALIEAQIKKAMIQLEKDLKILTGIFCFLSPQELKMIEIDTYCSFPNLEDPDILCTSCRTSCRFKEDFTGLLPNMRLPASSESLQCYLSMLTIYIGIGSMIEIKTPGDGYHKERDHLNIVSKHMLRMSSRTVMLSPEQICLQYEKFEDPELSNLCLIGPYGSGKTLGLLLLIRNALSMAKESDLKTQFLVIIWENEAKELKAFYKKEIVQHFRILFPEKSDQDLSFESDMSTIKIEVLFKEEAFEKYSRSSMEEWDTTKQINSLCKHIESVEKNVFLFVDELTVVHTNEKILGYVPFVLKDRFMAAHWSQLEPVSVKLFIAVTPPTDVDYLDDEKEALSVEDIEKNNINSVVKTIILPRVYRNNVNIHQFLKYLQTKCDNKKLEQYGFHPSQEIRGHEIFGEVPLWIQREPKDHVICTRNERCQNCFLNKNLFKTLQDLIQRKQIPVDDITVLIREMICSKKRRSVNHVRHLAKGWFGYLNIQSVMFDNEFEGMETPVALVIQNRDEIHGSIAPALSRACSRLIIVSSNGDEFLENAVTKGLLFDISKAREESDSFKQQDTSNETDLYDAFSSPKKDESLVDTEFFCYNTIIREEEMHVVSKEELNEKTKMESCVQYIKDYIGNRIFDSKLEQIILKYDYDTEKALDKILLEVVEDDSLSSGSWEKLKFLDMKAQEDDLESCSSMPQLTKSDGDFSSVPSITKSSSSLSSDQGDNDYVFREMSSLNDIDAIWNFGDFEHELNHLQSFIYRPNSVGDLRIPSAKMASELDLTSISLGNSRCVSPNLVGPPSPKFYRRQLEHLDLL